MNHRYGNRMAVQIDVLVHQQGRQLGRYQSRDISPYGVFLETGALDLKLGAAVDLTFILADDPDPRRVIKGMVIRRSYDGTAFMLADHYRNIFPHLKQQILETAPGAQRDGYAVGGSGEKRTKDDKPFVSEQSF